MNRGKVFRKAALTLWLCLLSGNVFSQDAACDALCSKQKEVKQFQDNDASPSLDQEIRRINSSRLHDSLIELRLLVQQNLAVAKSLLAGASGNDAAVLNQKISAFQKTLQDIEDSLKKEKVSSQGNSSKGAAIEVPPATLPPIVLSSPPVNKTAGACSTQVSSTFLALLARGTAELVVDGKDPSLAVGQIDRVVFAGFADLVSPPDDRESANQLLQKLYAKAETRRSVDKQLAAPAGGPGSTSVIDKPDFAKILGFAIEHGGVAQAISGTSLTLSSSPYSLLTAGSGGDTASNYERYSALTRLGASASFNIQDQNNPLASATRKQLNGWTVRYRFSPDRSTRSRDFLDYWNTKVVPSLNDSGVAISRAIEHIRGRNGQVVEAIVQRMIDPNSGFIAQYYSQHKNDARELLVTELQDEIACRVTELYKENMSKLDLSDNIRTAVQQDLNNYVQAQAKIQLTIEAAEAFSQELGKRWQGSISYAQNRPAITSNFSTLNLVFERTMPAPLKFTTNIGADLYHKPDALKHQDTLRSFSAAGSFEYVFGRSPFLTSAVDQSLVTLSLTGRYQRMPESRFIKGLKADIGVAQLKIQLPVSSGITLPFSVSYANSSELIKETHVRANFGLTFDLDKLTQLITAAQTGPAK